MNRTFDLTALRTIVTGEKLGSFARAAEHLGRSQSAVSMQIKKLEEQAGAQLFTRRGNKLVPTEAGQKLLEYAKQMIALNDEAAASISSKPNGATVQLGVPQDFANGILQKVLKRFSKEYSHVHVEAHIGRNYALADAVRAGQVDVALAFSSEQEPELGDCIAELDMIWAGSKNLSALDPKEPLPLVAFSYPCEFRKHSVDALEKSGMSWRSALTTPSLAGIWAALSADLGVTVRTRHQTPIEFLGVDKVLELPNLSSIYVHHMEHENLTPAAKRLSEILRDVTLQEFAQSSCQKKA